MLLLGSAILLPSFIVCSVITVVVLRNQVDLSLSAITGMAFSVPRVIFRVMR